MRVTSSSAICVQREPSSIAEQLDRRTARAAWAGARAGARRAWRGAAIGRGRSASARAIAAGSRPTTASTAARAGRRRRAPRRAHPACRKRSSRTASRPPTTSGHGGPGAARRRLADEALDRALPGGAVGDVLAQHAARLAVAAGRHPPEHCEHVVRRLACPPRRLSRSHALERREVQADVERERRVVVVAVVELAIPARVVEDAVHEQRVRRRRGRRPAPTGSPSRARAAACRADRRRRRGSGRRRAPPDRGTPAPRDAQAAVPRGRASASGMDLAIIPSAQVDATVLRASLDGIISIDALGVVLEFNPAAERMFGYSRDEAIGADMAELIVPPAQREAHRARPAAPARRRRRRGSWTSASSSRPSARTASPFPVEIAITRMSGSRRDLHRLHPRHHRPQARRAGARRADRAPGARRRARPERARRPRARRPLRLGPVDARRRTRRRPRRRC